jgi:Domain of unknown function (DUF4157)
MSALHALKLASLTRLQRFLSGRQTDRRAASRSLGLRLSLAPLPGFRRHGLVRCTPKSVVSPAPAFADGGSPYQPHTRPGDQPAETEPAQRPSFFRSLLTGAPTPPTPKLPPAKPESQPPPAPRLQRLVERAARGPAQPLSPGTRDFLGGRLKRWLPGVQLHQGPAADELTTALRADAVTFADRIVIRHRRYQPDRPEGVALLGHELFHVTEAASSRRLPVAAEEHAALSHERRLLHELRAPKPIALGRTAAEMAPAVGARPTTSRAQITTHVRAAAEDRPLPAPGPPAHDVISERHLAQIKDQVYRDLMQRLRTDFERGS